MPPGAGAASSEPGPGEAGLAQSPAAGGRPRVTAIIPAGNEAHQIADAVRTVLWADEILVVVDSASTDGTAQAAAGADPRVRVVVHEYGYSAAQKNWAIPQASHPWVLLLDADERVTPELEAEVRRLLEAGPDRDAYWIRRRNLYFGRVMRHGGWQTDSVIRLFRRECRYQDRRVHAEIEGYGTSGRLRSPILHDTFRSWDQYLAKLDQYTTWGAEQDYRDGKRAGFGNVVLRPAARLLKQYVLRLGFLDGIPGAIAAYLAVYGVFLKYAKLWDMTRKAGSRRPGE
jgi:glycosyltransferase involved in cell wall biosynthesis